jgi:hypothetical protein
VGFALPFPPLLALARTVLILLNWRASARPFLPAALGLTAVLPGWSGQAVAGIAERRLMYGSGSPAWVPLIRPARYG